MAAKNDITGASIQSKTNTKQYEDNYDLIFRKPKVEDTESDQKDEQETKE